MYAIYVLEIIIPKVQSENGGAFVKEDENGEAPTDPLPFDPFWKILPAPIFESTKPFYIDKL